MHLVWFKTLAIIQDILFFNKSMHYFTSFFFHEIFINTDIIVVDNIISTERSSTYPFNPVFFSCYWLQNLLKYFLDAINMVLFQSLLLWIDVFLWCVQTKNLFLLWYRLKQKLLFDLEKLVEYSAVIAVSSNPCVGSLTRTKISFFYYLLELMNYSLLHK